MSPGVPVLSSGAASALLLPTQSPLLHTPLLQLLGDFRLIRPDEPVSTQHSSGTDVPSGGGGSPELPGSPWGLTVG